MSRYNNPLRNAQNNRAKKALALAQGVPKDSPLLVTPSQKKSENLRRRRLRGEAPGRKYIYDCFGCSECPGCATLPESDNHPMISCSKPHRIGQCSTCGQSVMYRINPIKGWKRCPRCRESRGDIV